MGLKPVSFRDAAAASVTRPQQIRRVTLDTDRLQPEPGQVTLALEGCGVCASNVPVWQGRDWFDYPRPPGEPGHEGWGTVVDVGPQVKDLAAGDRVLSLGQHAFATHEIVDAKQCVKLPDHVPGFPGEPVACAVNIVDRAGVKRGDSVLVLGVGFLGALLVRVLDEAGHAVAAASRRATGRDIARQMGATEQLDADQLQQQADAVGGFFDPGRYDVVIETTGKQQGLDQATKLVRQGGRLVVAGFHQDGPRQIDMQLWNWRGIDVINAHERDSKCYRRGMQRAVTFVSEGKLDLDVLLTHRLPFSELDEALTLTAERPEGFLKAVVQMTVSPGKADADAAAASPEATSPSSESADQSRGGA